MDPEEIKAQAEQAKMKLSMEAEQQKVQGQMQLEDRKHQQRMEQLATDVSHLTAVIAKSLPAMQSNVSDISNKITIMSTEMKAISHSTSSLASSTQQMGVNVWEMNNNISKPLSLMNKMIPFARNVAPIQYQQGNPFYSNTRKINYR